MIRRPSLRVHVVLSETERSAIRREVAMQPPPYQPRETQSSVLVWLLREHLDDFLERAAGTGPNPGVPRFVERQLRDRVLPRAPYRQWVLTLPSQLARTVAYDAPLAAQVFGLLADQLARGYRRAAHTMGISAPHAGCVLEV